MNSFTKLIDRVNTHNQNIGIPLSIDELSCMVVAEIVGPGIIVTQTKSKLLHVMVGQMGYEVGDIIRMEQTGEKYGDAIGMDIIDEDMPF